MGAAGDVGMDELHTGKVRCVSINSAGSFVRPSVYLLPP